MILQDTVALVTGAARRLGRAIALGLAREGCHVVVHYGRSREAAQETSDAIREMGREALTFAADLAQPGQIEALFSGVEDRFGRLDVLINSAASFGRKPFEEITVEDWDAAQAVNARAPFLCIQRAACLMRGTAGRVTSSGDPDAPAAVVNFGDMSGVTTWRGYVHHGVSKAGILHLTRLTARELGPDIRVNAIVPGPVLPAPGEAVDSVSWAAKGERVPLGRTGEASHIVDSVVFLTKNDYVTGDTLFVDGGEHLLPGGRAGRDGG